MDTDKFKQRLLTEKENLEREIKAYQAQDPYLGKERMSESYDDDISEMEGHDRVTATENELKTHLEEVEEALKRIDNGSYGKCAECGQVISEERLEVMPTANYCANCQEKKG